MKIKITNLLTKTEKDQVLSLQAKCNSFDNLKNEAYLSTEINVLRNLPSFFLGYEGNELIAFIASFMPDNTAAEITTFVHPKFRSKGYFRQLFSCVKEIYAMCSVPKLQFCLEYGSRTGIEVAEHFGTTALDRSEYTLFIREYNVPFKSNPLKLVYINTENIDIFTPYLNECYGKDERDILSIAVASRDRIPFAVCKENEPVGFFVLLTEPGKTVIHCVAVRKILRGQGYGKLLMDHATREALKVRTTAELDVDSDNPAAYHIYKSMGYKEKLRLDYYDFALSKH